MCGCDETAQQLRGRAPIISMILSRSQSQKILRPDNSTNTNHIEVPLGVSFPVSFCFEIETGKMQSQDACQDVTAVAWTDTNRMEQLLGMEFPVSFSSRVETGKRKIGKFGEEYRDTAG